MTRAMGLRIVVLLWVAAVAVIAVVPAVADDDYSRARIRGFTSQGAEIAIRLGLDDRVVAFDTTLNASCSDRSDPVHVRWTLSGEEIPFVEARDGTEAYEVGADDNPDGSRSVAHYRMHARVAGDAVTGTVRVDAKTTRGGAVIGTCRSGPVSFRVTRD